MRARIKLQNSLVVGSKIQALVKMTAAALLASGAHGTLQDPPPKPMAAPISGRSFVAESERIEKNYGPELDDVLKRICKRMQSTDGGGLYTLGVSTSPDVKPLPDIYIGRINYNLDAKDSCSMSYIVIDGNSPQSIGQQVRDAEKNWGYRTRKTTLDDKSLAARPISSLDY
jgi:hypothetical protein